MMRAATLAIVGLVIVQAPALKGRATDPIPVVLWRDPGPVAARDLFWGSGSAERAPRGPFRFEKEARSGTQPKLSVTDAAGVGWDVKLGVEPRAEIAANRLLWALGYIVEETYFVREGIISGATDPGRAREHIAADGRFQDARFRRRDSQFESLDKSWTFGSNPFNGRPELSGLLIVMTMISNWDIDGPRNNKILKVTTAAGVVEHLYLVGDLGGTFGRMGSPLSKHTKWNVADFQAEGFIDEVHKDRLELDWDGLDPVSRNVPLDHARWFAALASQLTETQIVRAFEAAGASPAETEGFSKKIAGKIAELQAAVTGKKSG